MKRESIKELAEKRTISLFEISIMIISTFAFAFLISLATPSESGLGIAETAKAQEQSFCCEKTKSGAFCQDAPESDCDTSNGLRTTPSSCEATSFCKLGCCYDSNEGTCAENTPEIVCSDAQGAWSDSAECSISQCNLGCCVIETQAAFVSLVRCKKLSAFYGVDTDFRPDIKSEDACIAIAQSQDQGACVFEEDFTNTCKFTTRENCKETNSTFYKDKLCTAEEFGTDCGPTTKTTCVEGSDEVYFVDTCGNPANIYDSSKINDNDYWTNVYAKSESCGSTSSTGNADSASCGNCDYLAGSICSKSEFGDAKATYGDYICKDLNCKDTSNGEDMRHGETWCAYDSETGQGKDAVGSRHYRHICVSGEETTEPCDDFRQQTCIQNSIETSSGESFSQAACRSNRWQDCIAQIEKEDCENTDKRDCIWTASSESVENGTIGCTPDVPPGLDFWNSDSDAKGICAAATKTCEVKFEKGLLSGGWECKENCDCLNEDWAQKQNSLCTSLGDCGGYVNYVGEYTDDGYEYTIDGDKRTISETGADVVTWTGKVIKALASKATEKGISGMAQTNLVYPDKAIWLKDNVFIDTRTNEVKVNKVSSWAWPPFGDRVIGYVNTDTGEIQITDQRYGMTYARDLVGKGVEINEGIVSGNTLYSKEEMSSRLKKQKAGEILTTGEEKLEIKEDIKEIKKITDESDLKQFLESDKPEVVRAALEKKSELREEKEIEKIAETKDPQKEVVEPSSQNPQVQVTPPPSIKSAEIVDTLKLPESVDIRIKMSDESYKDVKVSEVEIEGGKLIYQGADVTTALEGKGWDIDYLKKYTNQLRNPSKPLSLDNIQTEYDYILGSDGKIYPNDATLPVGVVQKQTLGGDNAITILGASKLAGEYVSINGKKGFIQFDASKGGYNLVDEKGKKIEEIANINNINSLKGLEKATLIGRAGVDYPKTFGLFDLGFAAGYISQGVTWSLGVAGAIQMLGSLFMPDEKETIDLLTKSATIGIMGGNILYGLFGKGDPTKQGASGILSKAFSLSKGAAAGIGIGIAVIYFVMNYKKEKTQVVSFSCLPWQPPTGGDDCEKCNDDLNGCSEYKCKSLGQACEILNKGTEEEKCAWINPRDVTSPVISQWDEVLTAGYSYEDVQIRPPGLGMRIENTEASDGCIKAFTPLDFGVITNEPTQCKIDFQHKAGDSKTNAFDSMTFWMGESNLFDYNHSQTLSLPGPNASEQSPLISDDGTFTLYIRCEDANGNFNEDEFAVRYCVEKGPDTTPPKITATSITTGMPVAYNTDNVSIDVYVNEPADCRWSKDDRDYSAMENSMSCAASVSSVNPDLSYTCKGTLTSIQNRQDNPFYFRCKDNPGAEESDRNVNTESYSLIIKGTEPLYITSAKPNNTIIYSSTTIANLSLEATTAFGYKDGEATCYYSTTGNSNDYIMFFNTDSYQHKQSQNLLTGNYTYYLKCIDLGGNTDNTTIKFNVSIDTTAPRIVRAYKDSNNLVVATDEDAICAYGTKTCSYTFTDGIAISTSAQKTHKIGWNADTTYYIKCKDKFNNQPLPDKCSIAVKAYELG